jgi:glutamine synthetase
MCIVTNQWVNSYKRLTPGFEAPVHITWAKRSANALVRVPMYKPGHEKSVRVELRSPDAACNPYLTFAVMLAAGLEGIKHGYDLPDPVEHKKAGGELLPQSLGEAIQAAEHSKFLKDVLGEHILHSLIENKKMEWNEYCAEISDFERRKYLPVL